MSLSNGRLEWASRVSLLTEPLKKKNGEKKGRCKSKDGAMQGWCNVMMVQSKDGAKQRWCKGRIALCKNGATQGWHNTRMVQSKGGAKQEWCYASVVQSNATLLRSSLATLLLCYLATSLRCYVATLLLCYVAMRKHTRNYDSNQQNIHKLNRLHS